MKAMKAVVSPVVQVLISQTKQENDTTKLLYKISQIKEG
jgi:hypothetical protein